ncbi:hypothetical protein [Lysobacter tyrosinilyticus]
MRDQDSTLLELFEKYPDIYRSQYRESILQGVVVLGMNPEEARVAGGAFAYRVIPDRAVWSTNADPRRVIGAQSLTPDESEIWMMFKNETQCTDGAVHAFRVHFQRGLAVAVEDLGVE